MSVLKLNNENFRKTIENGISLVDFYADWCGPCKMIAPIVDEISNERDDITVGKINVDESLEIASEYGVMSIPTLIVFKNGKEANRIIGYRSKDEILSALN